MILFRRYVKGRVAHHSVHGKPVGNGWNVHAYADVSSQHEAAVFAQYLQMRTYEYLLLDAEGRVLRHLPRGQP